MRDQFQTFADDEEQEQMFAMVGWELPSVKEESTTTEIRRRKTARD